jgi:hopanoid biosynthesis associated protein HpnK
VRRLIINADDLGFTSGINRAIVEAHTRGVVTSSTVMASGPAFAEAAQLAKTVPRLSIGCHVVLIDGDPVLGAAQVSSLIERGSHVPRFREGLKIFAARALAGYLDQEQIEAEAMAQIRKIQSTGIIVTHVDTHKHTHVFPRVLRPLLRAAAACGIRAVRNPFGPRRLLRSDQLRSQPGLWMRYAEMRVLRCFSGQFRQTVDRQGLLTTDGTLGIEVTGVLDQNLFRAIAQNLPEGTWEFVCHPGYDDADLKASKTRLQQSRETELRVLTLPEAKEMLSHLGILLISYRDLAVGRPD